MQNQNNYNNNYNNQNSNQNFGQSMNKDVDNGQIEGGLVQGIGWMTLEEIIYNEQGKLISKFVKKPINSIAAMTAYGTWKDTGCTAPGKSAVTLGKCHPNSIARSLSSDDKPL